MNFRHSSDFEINRPNGTGDNLLLIFKTAASLDLNGKTVQVLPDSAVLYSKGTPQIYRAFRDIYVNHWIHMDCCENDDFHLTSGLPFNSAVKLTNAAEAEDIMRMIGREELSELPSKEQYMDLLIRMLILKVGDGCRSCNPSGETNPHRDAMTRLRAEIYNSAGQFSGVESLASAVNLSPSYFQRLYKEQFGVSCYEDLLSARIKAAQYYLKNTDMSVKEIASSCGYENDVCFMRRFRQRTGLTPTEYREK
ncbi:MAG: AraC family transcriptional regulator [Oscillospiraceae bacterium]|nr:AraC family transcriptional regulator [Oscillospiraceae bacterium]